MQASCLAPSPPLALLTDVIVLDVDDELGERLELETAAPEPAGIREERSGGDARHVCGVGAFTGWRGEGGPGAGVVKEEARVFGFGVGAPQSAERRSRHRAARQDSGGRSWEAGGTVGVGMGVGLAGGSLRHDLPTCWDANLCP